MLARYMLQIKDDIKIKTKRNIFVVQKCLVKQTGRSKNRGVSATEHSRQEVLEFLMCWGLVTYLLTGWPTRRR